MLNFESARKITPEGMTFLKAEEVNIGALGRFDANWIINVLPYLEEQPLYDSFDLNGPYQTTSQTAAITMSQVLRSPPCFAQAILTIVSYTKGRAEPCTAAIGPAGTMPAIPAGSFSVLLPGRRMCVRSR